MNYQELFNHMHDEHDLILLEEEMQEIIYIVNKMQEFEIIEKAFNAGQKYGVYMQGGSYDKKDDVDLDDYLKSLKL